MKTIHLISIEVMKRLVGALLIAALAFAPSLPAQNSGAAADSQTHGIKVANMDRSVTPGDDFFDYASGAWIKRTEIPPDRGRVGVFNALLDISTERVRGLIEEAGKANAPVGSDTRKIADLYASYMDEQTIESKGFAPLKPHLDAIATIKDKKELARALGETSAGGRRCAEQHKFSHAESLRTVGGAGVR